MNLSNIWLIIQKEIRYAWKDKFLVFSNYLLPFILSAILLAILSDLGNVIAFFKENKKLISQQPEIQKIYIAEDGDANSFPLASVLGPTFELSQVVDPVIKNAMVEYLKDVENENKNEQESNEKNRLIAYNLLIKEFSRLKIDKFLFVKRVNGYDNYQFHLFYQVSNGKSAKNNEAIKKALEKYNEEEVKKRLAVVHKDPTYLRPINFVENELTPKNIKTGMEISKIVPMMIIYMMLAAILPSLILSFVREREHNTIYALYLTAVSESEIMIGKFFAVVIQALVSISSYGISSLTIFFHFSRIENSLSPFTLPAYKVFFLILAVTVLVMLITSLLMFLVSFAQNANQAQVMASYSMMLLLPLGIVAVSGDDPLSWPMAIIPYLNVLWIVKFLFVQEIPWPFIFSMLLTNLTPTLLILFLSRGFLLKEFKTKKSDDVFGDIIKGGPSLGMGLILFISIFLYSFFIHFYLSGFLLIPIFITGIIVITYFISKTYKLKFQELLAFHLVDWKKMFLIFIGFGLLSQLHFPIGKELIKSSSVLDFRELTGILFWVILRPIIYEIVFRGIILKGFEKQYTQRASLIFSSLLFAMFYFSLIKFIPMFVLGLALGYLYQKSKTVMAPIVGHLGYSCFFYFN